MPNHTVEQFSRHNNAFAVDDPAVSKFIANRSLPGRLLDPYLLYRHDQRTVEVRFVNGCQQAVCGTLTAQDLAKALGLSVRICICKPRVYFIDSCFTYDSLNGCIARSKSQPYPVLSCLADIFWPL
jgi:hypothetical protein